MNKLKNISRTIAIWGLFIIGFLLVDYSTFTDNQAFGFTLMLTMAVLMFVYYKTETEEHIKKLKEAVNKK